MGVRRFLALELHVLDLGQAELAPIDWAGGQILEPQPRGRDGLILQRLLGVLTPFVGGSNDEALTEATFAVRGLEALARGGEKGIDIGLLERMRRVIELALNGQIIATATLPCHQVDTNVRPPTIRPCRP